MKRLLCALFFHLAAGAAFAAGGGAPFDFLKLDANARPVALGGAFVAVADDANAVWYNPAGLGLVKDNQATFMHNQYFQDVRQEFVSAALKPGIGAAVDYVDLGSFARTTLSNPSGGGLGSFGAEDLALVLGYGRSLDERFSVGAGARYIRERIDAYSASGLAADAGVLVRPFGNKTITFGAAVQNAGSKARFQSEAEGLPLLFRTGLAVRPFGDRLLAALDLLSEPHNGSTVSAGLEGVFAPLVLRAGYNGRNDAGSGITIGGGLVFSKVSFDYAFVPYGDLGDAHRFSFTARF